MGEIIIKISGKTNRRYILDDAKSINTLIEALDRSAIRIKHNPPDAADREFIEDALDVKRAVTEFERSGKTFKWNDIKAEFGL